MKTAGNLKCDTLEREQAFEWRTRCGMRGLEGCHSEAPTESAKWRAARTFLSDNTLKLLVSESVERTNVRFPTLQAQIRFPSGL